MQTIAEYNNILAAHIDRGKLESEGIESYIQNEVSSGIISGLTGAMIDPIRLQVHTEDVQAAREILGNLPG